MAEKQHKQTRLKIGKIISYAVMIVCLVFVAAAFISASAQKPMFLFGCVGADRQYGGNHSRAQFYIG